MAHLHSFWTGIRRRRTLWRLNPSMLIGGLAAAIALIFLWLVPAQAADVQIRPTNPQLGDTILVIVRGSEVPTIQFEGETYPAFAMGGDRYRALLPTTPLDAPGRKVIQVTTDGSTQNLAVSLRDRSFQTQRITVRGGGSGGTEHEFSRLRTFRETISPEKYWSGAFRRPADGRVTSPFGVRRYYNGVFAQDYYHRGVDYAGGVGAPIYAPAAGRVALVGRVSDGFVLNGNTIGVDHGQGVSSVFIHLSRIDVNEGDMVQAGQRIGGIGATGSATGPNLHWGLFVNGKSVDPVPWRNQGFD
ncbi:M23 family metallopeptidase [Leptolyngbya sp. AN02str]|uniref:M23 family metallopeptidase n=1 Tax=Leptolyngbya sp. AN02str TaxID=3423363 RepID=UPI003D316C5F